MSFNQWKILNNLKDAFSKFSNDKSIQNALGKDFFEVIQKIPPSMYNNSVIKYFETSFAQSTKQVTTSTNKIENSYIPNVINTIKNKIVVTSQKQKGIVPKWKKNITSKPSISCRTDQILFSIDLAMDSTENSLLNSLEIFILHLKKYPEVKNKAVQAGAVRLLLRIQAKKKNELVKGATREALAILGYTDPVPSKGIRILSMDGGGIRGLLVLEMLKKLEELTGKKIYELFDFFCGVSTGAILSFSMGVHHRSLDEISYGYEQISREVFRQSSWRGTGNLVWSHSYYDTSLWEQKLRQHLGTSTLISTSRNPRCPKLCAVSAVVNQARLSAYIFRNYALPWKFQSQYLGTYDSELWQAARASAAAPTYFEEFKLGNLLHQDGGILVNNPTAIAFHEAKLLWPNTPVQCVVSFGTGRTIPSPVELAREQENGFVSNNTSWSNKFYKILDSATDTEAVHIMLNDLLPDNVYYRFNPYLTEFISMVETDPKKLDQLKRDALMYLRRNEDKFQEVAKVLLEKKTPIQNLKDYINVQRETLGI